MSQPMPPEPSQPFQPPTGPVPPGYYPPPSQPLYPQDQAVPPQYYESLPLHMQPPDWRYLQNPIRPMNKKAHSAQMFGLLSLILTPFGLVAIILGFMALSEIQLTGEDGASQAKLGLGLGFAAVFLSCIYYYLFFTVAR
jgi:hypothetical protein